MLSWFIKFSWAAPSPALHTLKCDSSVDTNISFRGISASSAVLVFLAHSRKRSTRHGRLSSRKLQLLHPPN